jgi:hypothetical protein
MNKKLNIGPLLQTPFFVLLVHAVFIGFAVAICVQLHRYHEEQLQYEVASVRADTLEQTLAELKSSGSYVSSQTYRLKVAKRNYTNKKIEGERVLNTAQIETVPLKNDTNYIPDAVRNPTQSSLVLWNACVHQSTLDACQKE